MKTMKYFLSMAALALVGAMTVSCSSDDNIIDQAQQPVNKNNVVTLTTTVGFADDGTTRALTGTGVKTFAAGETMAIYYWKNKGNDHVKAVSAPLTPGDITNGGKSATFTFTLDNPYKDMSVSYVYPAAMANADFTPNYDALYNNQDGTLTTLASNFDFCTRSGAWSGENLPSLTLVNQLAILAINLKNSTGASDITGDITGMTISDGTNTYTVSRSAVAGPIYVAIRPTSDATITVTATDGTKNYTKTLTTKTYEAGNGYPVSWRMTRENITWNSSKVAGIDINENPEDNSFESDGITVAAFGDSGANFTDSKMSFGGSDSYFTFTSSVGNIKKIEINYTGDVYGYEEETPVGWSLGVGTFTWEGDPATSVTLSSSGYASIDGITSIVFTLE